MPETIRVEVADVATALTNIAESVFVSLLGKPTSRTSRELRYGRRGSLACRIAGPHAGRWTSFEDGTHGDLLDMIQKERRVDPPGAARIALSEFLSGRPLPAAPTPRPSSSRPSIDHDAEAKAAYGRGLWLEAESLVGTTGERYFVETRRIDVSGLSLAHAIRWHPAISAVVSLMRHPITGEPCGLHRTFIDANAAKVDRRMIGRQGIVELCAREEVGHGLGLTEGIEDGLAVLASGWRPVWVATSAGAIAKFPVVEGIDCLTVFGDADKVGNNAASECTGRWIEHGREAAIVLPPQSEVSL